MYNADEMGTYCRALPDSTYVAKEQHLHGCGFKTVKDRITALVCCSLEGTREKLLVIGKSNNLQCFQDVKTLPVMYEFSHNSWMTGSIWTDWLKNWNKCLEKEKKKIVLLIDNCSAHADVLGGLSQIDIGRLPPNSITITQPCDLGIIRTMKAYFRYEMQ